MRLAFTALALCLAVFTAAPASAQDARENQTPLRGEAWYQAQLIELAEVLGGAHYLRILCEGRGDQRWRDYMLGVLSREPRLSDTLRDAFNLGFRQEESRFADCDRPAEQYEAELRARGLRVSGALRARHGD